MFNIKAVYMQGRRRRSSQLTRLITGVACKNQEETIEARLSHELHLNIADDAKMTAEANGMRQAKADIESRVPRAKSLTRVERSTDHLGADNPPQHSSAPSNRLIS